MYQGWVKPSYQNGEIFSQGHSQSVKLAPSPTQSPLINTQTPQTGQEELEYPQIQTTRAMNLLESPGTNWVYKASQLGHTAKKGGQKCSLVTEWISNDKGLRKQGPWVQHSDPKQAEEPPFDQVSHHLSVLCMNRGRNPDWEELCIQKLHPSMELETISVEVMRIFLLPKYLTHLCLVFKIVAKEFCSTLNQGFWPSLYVLWTPLPASRLLHLNNLHHNVSCAPGTVIFNFNLWLKLILREI